MPVELVEVRDAAAVQMRCMRAGLMRQANEVHPTVFEDVAVAIQALQDPADTVREWGGVRRDLLGQG